MSLKVPKVLLVDDHVMICESIVNSMELPNNHKFCAFTVAEALTICKSNSIDIAFVDARLPPDSGIALIKQLHKLYPFIKIVGITSYEERATLLDFTHAGVLGILLKNSDRKQVVNECIRAVHNGDTYFSEAALKILGNPIYSNEKPVFTRFSEKELAIIEQLSKGLSSKEISEIAGLTPFTLDDYRKRMMRRANAKNTTELINFAHRNGLL